MSRVTCADKTGYPTWTAANRVLRRFAHSSARRDADNRGHLVVYRCRFCPDWHVGRDSFAGGVR